MNIETKIKNFLQEQIEEYDPEFYHIEINKNLKNDNTIDIVYHTCFHDDIGKNHEEIPILNYLSQPHIASQIRSLTFTSEDEGCNGTQNWDLEYLVNNEVSFNQLEVLKFPLTTPQDHNQKIITYQDSYDENNGIGLLLNKCPKLQHLEISSAPGTSFFERPLHGLKQLHVQCAYNQQNFIKNLSQSKCFQEIEWLFFQDYNQTYMENYQQNCVTFEDYLALVNAASLPLLRTIVLEDTVISPEQKKELLTIAKNQTIQLTFQ